MSCRTFLALALALAAACDPPAEAAAVEPRASADGEAAPVRPRRGRLLAGERVQRQVVWPGPETIAPLRARLPAGLRADIDRSPVPVLVPADPDLLARAQLYAPDGPQGFGYALSLAHGEGTITVHGSRVATLVPGVGHVRGSRRIRGGEGHFGNNDGIRSATWIEHGVAYDLGLECDDPDGPACTDARLSALVEGLVYVGGRGPAGGAR